jgi:hypothetical protein
MQRSTAMIATILTALLCGLPSVILLCMGVLAMLGTQVSEVMAQNPGSTSQDVMLGAGIFFCFGFLLLLIPLLVGFFSFRMSQNEDLMGNEMIPPPA